MMYRSFDVIDSSLSVADSGNVKREVQELQQLWHKIRPSLGTVAGLVS